ncbi:MAG: sialidase family protein, partial [Candidatus Firestonebacteria bacterium]
MKRICYKIGISMICTFLVMICFCSYLNAGVIDTSETNNLYAKDRKLVLTSDGKLVAFYCKGSTSSGPLYYSISSDGGSSWSVATLIGGGNAFANQSSVWKDNLDNIYVVYV